MGDVGGDDDVMSGLKLPDRAVEFSIILGNFKTNSYAENSQ